MESLGCEHGSHASRAAGVALFAVAVIASGCTEEGFLGGTFENDLGRPVVLAFCHSAHSDRCDDPDYRVRIAPGHGRGERHVLDKDRIRR